MDRPKCLAGSVKMHPGQRQMGLFAGEDRFKPVPHHGEAWTN
jgi:hypothetical protein